MDTSQEFAAVQLKHKMNAPVTMREVAVIIQNDEESLFRFICDNDYPQVYGLLHKGQAPMTIGRNAPFRPDKKRVEGELKSLLVKKDFRTLNDVLDKFRINMNTPGNTTNPKLLTALQDVEAIVMTPTGYKFNLILQ